MDLPEKLPDNATHEQKYEPAMLIETQEDADKYFEVLIDHCLRLHELNGKEITREEAQGMERTSLAYVAGYYDLATRQRVERLFRCEHPVLGPAPIDGSIPTYDDAVQKGREWAEKHLKPGEDLPGATGQFPRGKLNKDDDGELKIAVGQNKGVVFMEFGKLISWIAMEPAQAEEFARTLLQYVEEAKEAEAKEVTKEVIKRVGEND
jgi:hypothetical protein